MIKINIVGDISLNNKYNDFRRDNLNPFEEVIDLFADADFNLGNLECLCTEGIGENKLKVPRLKTNKDTLFLLKPLRFNMLSLAHNHIYDNCEEGIACTREQLQALNIQPIGYRTQLGEDSYVWKTNVKGIPIVVITALHKDTNPCLPEVVQLNIPWYNADKIASDIKNLKTSASFVIVFLHWGGKCEKGFMPDWYEIQDAHRFIDEGADVVIGGHSHTEQPYEKYKGKYIFYSLGNFCFDDVETDGKLYTIGRYRKRKGLITTLNIQEKNFQYDVQVQRIQNENCFIRRNKRTLKMRFRNIRFQWLAHCKPLWKLNFILFRKLSPLFFYLFEDTDTFRTKLSKFKLKKILNHIKS